MGCHLRIVFLGLYVGRLVFRRRNGVGFVGFAWVLHSVGGLLIVQKRIYHMVWYLRKQTLCL